VLEEIIFNLDNDNDEKEDSEFVFMGRKGRKTQKRVKRINNQGSLDD
jgi:hypothetical protein